MILLTAKTDLNLKSFTIRRAHLKMVLNINQLKSRHKLNAPKPSFNRSSFITKTGFYVGLLEFHAKQIFRSGGKNHITPCKAAWMSEYSQEVGIKKANGNLFHMTCQLTNQHSAGTANSITNPITNTGQLFLKNDLPTRTFSNFQLLMLS